MPIRQAMGHGNWSMRITATGEYVGSVGVLNYLRDLVPAFDAPELGWGAATAFQGQGLAREGLEAALAWADTVLGAARTVVFNCLVPLVATAIAIVGLGERPGLIHLAGGALIVTGVLMTRQGGVPAEG